MMVGFEEGVQRPTSNAPAWMDEAKDGGGGRESTVGGKGGREGEREGGRNFCLSVSLALYLLAHSFVGQEVVRGTRA